MARGARRGDAQAAAIAIDDEPAVEAYHTLVTHADKVEEQIRDTLRQPDICVPFLQPGRLLPSSMSSSRPSESMVASCGV